MRGYSERLWPTLVLQRASRELGHDLGHQALHLLGLVEDRVEQDQFRARLCHLAQTSHAGVGWPVDGEGLQAAQLEERVEAVQRLADSPPRALGVVVDGDVDALADLEAGGVAPRLGERLPYDRHLLGALFRGGRPSPEEAVAVLDARRNASGWLAPNQIGGCGFWNGFGSMAASFNCQNRPSKLTRGSVQSAFINRSPSLNRATRLVGSTWNAENIRCRPPVPTPTSIRPRLNWSSVLRSLARWTGLCSGVTNTTQPRRIRSVQAAA